MEKIITNKNNLNDKEINDIVRRVKVMLVNSKNEVLLGYSYNEYQFPGGKQSGNEELLETVKREVKEETGIILNNDVPKPFACAIGYYKDWPSIGINRKIEIYYYEILTDELPNIDNIKLTENEMKGNFKLKYINLNNIENELNSNTISYGDEKGISREMLKLIKIYKKNKQYL